jgi:hypothetical protein
MPRPKKEHQTRLIQTTVDEGMYRALCEQALYEDRPLASVIRQALSMYFAHINRSRARSSELV